MNRKIILTIVIVILVIIALYQIFFRKKEAGFSLADIKRGNVVQEISETGAVKKGEEINLSFKTSGKIEKIYVKVGDKVKENDILAELEKTQIISQLDEARAGLAAVQASFDKLVAGSRPEEIAIARTELNSAQTAFLNTLGDCYLKADNALNTVTLISRNYFQIASLITENKIEIEKAVSQLKSSYDLAREKSTDENIKNALSQADNFLTIIGNELSDIRNLFEENPYSTIVSSTDKTSTDIQRTNINTGKLSLDSANSQLQLAKDRLTLLIAPPRQEDINFYQAQIQQSQAKIEILENQYEDTKLKASFPGQVTKIQKREGEIVQSFSPDTIISLLPESPFQIKADIYEEDVVKMKVGNPVDISLVSFPERILKGKIISIDPAGKIKEGVVYYETTIDFEEIPEGIKPEMTADLVIKTDSREDVLMVPTDAIQKKNGKTTVEVSKNGTTENREIEIGLQGSQGTAEIISGLSEGEKVILK
jgi:HlyD family secretion protein